MRRRTRAREIAIQFLYQLDLRDDDISGDLEAFLEREGQDDELRGFSRQLILGTQERLPEIDAVLTRVARNWDLRRMAVLDRNILRMAAYELLYCTDVPPKVTINEAIELGKRFSTANSGGFINGILDRIRIDAERDARATGTPIAGTPAAGTPIAGNSAAGTRVPAPSGESRPGTSQTGEAPSSGALPGKAPPRRALPDRTLPGRALSGEA